MNALESLAKLAELQKECAKRECNHPFITAAAHTDFSALLEYVRGLTEWRAIESAPKDGTKILLWSGFNILVGLWLHSAWRVDHSAWVFQTTPTHWMPLSAPPTGEVK